MTAYGLLDLAAVTLHGGLGWATSWIQSLRFLTTFRALGPPGAWGRPTMPNILAISASNFANTQLEALFCFSWPVVVAVAINGHVKDSRAPVSAFG